MYCTCTRYYLCWHQVFVIMGLTFDTLQPTVEFLIWLCRWRDQSCMLIPIPYMFFSIEMSNYKDEVKILYANITILTKHQSLVTR